MCSCVVEWPPKSHQFKDDQFLLYHQLNDDQKIWLDQLNDDQKDRIRSTEWWRDRGWRLIYTYEDSSF